MSDDSLDEEGLHCDHPKAFCREEIGLRCEIPRLRCDQCQRPVRPSAYVVMVDDNFNVLCDTACLSQWAAALHARRTGVTP